MRERRVAAVAGVMVLLLVGAAWLLLRDTPRQETTSSSVVETAQAPQPATPLRPEPQVPAPVELPAPTPAKTAPGGELASPLLSDPDVTPWRITGRVVDERDQPIAGAEVRAWLAKGMAEHFARKGLDASEELRTTTRADGSFELSLPRLRVDVISPWMVARDGPTNLFVRHDGHAALMHPLKADAKPNVGTLKLQPAAQLVGRVLDATRRPLAGAMLEITPDEQTPDGDDLTQRLSALGYLGPGSETASLLVVDESTGSDGRFAVNRLPPGPADVRIFCPGHRTLVLEDAAVVLGPPLDLGDLVLADGLTIAGRVVDEMGRPLPDAEVYALEGQAGSEHPTALLCKLEGLRAAPDALGARSAADGTFTLKGELGGNVTVAAFAEGREPAAKRDVAPGATGVQIPLLPQASTLLAVVDALTEEAIADARVLAARPYEYRDSVPLEVEAKGKGSFVVHGTSESGCTVRVEAPGYGAQVVDISKLEAVVHLAKEARIAGHVLDDANAPVAKAAVRAFPTGHGEVFSLAVLARTDEQGAFELAGLGAGTVRMVARSPDQRQAEDKLTVEAGQQVTGHVLRLAGATGTIAGRVISADGTPVHEMKVDVVVVLDGEKPIDHRDKPDPEGRFEFDELPAGTWRVIAEPGAEQVVVLPPGGHVEVELVVQRWPRLRGFVRAGEVGVEGARIIASTTNDSASARSAADGSYDMELDFVGSAGVIVQGPGGVRGDMHSLTVAPDGVYEMDFQLGAARIEGRVADRDSGKPLAAASVWSDVARAEEPQNVFAFATRDPVTTDAEGRFVLPGLAAGEYQVQAETKGFLPAVAMRVTLADGEARTDLLFELVAGAQVRGRVLTEAGVPAVDETFVRLDGDAVEHGRNTTTGDGAFSFSNLPAGSYTLSVLPEGSQPWGWSPQVDPASVRARMTVAVEAGETREVVITLPASP